jgi:hypothetical protein
MWRVQSLALGLARLACIDTTPPKDSPQVLSMLPARAAELLRDKPYTASGSRRPRRTSRFRNPA